MSRITTLQVRVARVCRTLFASLPLSTRLAHIMAKLAGLDLQALGRSIGAVLIRKKVEGLPDVHGKPALSLPTDKDPTKLLPHDYMAGIASDLRRHLLAKFRSEQLVDMTISNWLFHFIVEGKWQHLKEGAKLGEALGYIRVSLERTALDEIKRVKRKKYDYGGPSMDAVDEEGHHEVNLSDPKAEADFYHHIPVHELQKVRSDLTHKVHPDAPLYLDLLLQGYSPAEILGFKGNQQTEDVLLPHFKSQSKSPYKVWKIKYEPEIRKVLQKYMEA